VLWSESVCVHAELVGGDATASVDVIISELSNHNSRSVTHSLTCLSVCLSAYSVLQCLLISTVLLLYSQRLTVLVLVLMLVAMLVLALILLLVMMVTTWGQQRKQSSVMGSWLQSATLTCHWTLSADNCFRRAYVTGTLVTVVDYKNMLTSHFRTEHNWTDAGTDADAIQVLVLVLVLLLVLILILVPGEVLRRLGGMALQLRGLLPTAPLP